MEHWQSGVDDLKNIFIDNETLNYKIKAPKHDYNAALVMVEKQIKTEVQSHQTVTNAPLCQTYNGSDRSSEFFLYQLFGQTLYFITQI